MGVFGPLITRPPREPEVNLEVAEAAAALELSRKRPLAAAAAGDRQTNAQAAVNGSPTKRARLSNGCENGVDATTPMEIDHAQQQPEPTNHAYPSPFEGEQAETPAPRTEGPEQATQVEKVSELATETTFISLMEEDLSPDNASARASPILLNCEWSPRDAPLLAAVGTDALARVWNVSRVTAADPVPSHVNGSIVGNLVPADTPSTALFTNIAWNRDGTAIAVASQNGQPSQTRVSIWDSACNYINSFILPESPLLKLKWNPFLPMILTISPEGGSTLVSVYHTISGSTVSHMLNLTSDLLDAAWVNEWEFLVCSGDLLKCLKTTEYGIIESKTFSTRPDDSFTQVLYDQRSNLAATASEGGMIDVGRLSLSNSNPAPSRIQP